MIHMNVAADECHIIGFKLHVCHINHLDSITSKGTQLSIELTFASFWFCAGIVHSYVWIFLHEICKLVQMPDVRWELKLVCLSTTGQGFRTAWSDICKLSGEIFWNNHEFSIISFLNLDQSMEVLEQMELSLLISISINSDWLERTNSWDKKITESFFENRMEMKELLDFHISNSFSQILIDDHPMSEWLSKCSISSKERYKSRHGMKSTNLSYLKEYISSHLEFGNKTIPSLGNQKVIRNDFPKNPSNEICFRLHFGSIEDSLRKSGRFRWLGNDFLLNSERLNWPIEWDGKYESALRRQRQSRRPRWRWYFCHQSNLGIKHHIRNNQRFHQTINNYKMKIRQNAGFSSFQSFISFKWNGQASFRILKALIIHESLDSIQESIRNLIIFRFIYFRFTSRINAWSRNQSTIINSHLKILFRIVLNILVSLLW
jgi:hypothetical protein